MTHNEFAKGSKIPKSGLLLFLMSACFGLLVICGIIISVLFVQVKELKIELARWGQRIAANEAQLGKVVKENEQKNSKQIDAPGASRRELPLVLSDEDLKVVRAFIKVLPSKSGGKEPLRPIAEITQSSSVPVPEALVSQLPKLRGARFIVDGIGAIILIGPGSNRADAVINPQ